MDDKNKLFDENSELYTYPGFEFIDTPDKDAAPDEIKRETTPETVAEHSDDKYFDINIPDVIAPAAFEVNIPEETAPEAPEAVIPKESDTISDKSNEVNQGVRHTEEELKRLAKERKERVKQKRIAARRAKRAARKDKNKGLGFARKFNRWLLRILLVLIALVVLVYAVPGLAKLLGIYNYTIDMQNAVLGEARIEANLIVLEQDVEQTVTIHGGGLLGWLLGDQLAGIEKDMTFYATGYFTVDLEQLSDESIEVDRELMTVTITVPYPVLDHTEFRVEDTLITQTELGVFALGDVRMTEEQHNELESMALRSMETELNSDSVRILAQNAAKDKIAQLFQTVISAVSDEYLVIVVLENAEVNGG